MVIIGITGGSGAGKTTALNVLAELGALILDCDAVYHELLESGGALLSDIESRFPGTVKNGVLDRKSLGAVVFSDTKALADLNALTHEHVKNEVLRRLNEKKPALAALDAIGLFESGLDKLCNYTVAVVSPAVERVKRLMLREGVSEEYARLRISAQRPDEFYIENCDYVLRNEGMTREEFEKKTRGFFAELLNGGNVNGKEE